MDINITNEQRLDIINSISLLAGALNISGQDILEAIRKYGSITDVEMFMLINLLP